MATTLNDQIGRVLGGRYRLVAPIGSGASAQVYLASPYTVNQANVTTIGTGKGLAFLSGTGITSSTVSGCVTN